MRQLSNRLARLLKLEHWQLIMIYLIIYDVIAVNGAFFLALWLRFDLRFTMISGNYLTAWKQFTPIYTLMCFLVFWFLKLYKSIWQFASFTELWRVAVATAITAALHGVCITAFFCRMPISYYILGTLIQFCLVLAIRFSYRFMNLLRSRLKNSANKKRVMLIGAGQAGQMILRDISGAKEVTDQVVCIIDDNKNKWGRIVEGITVVGGREDILANVEKYKVDKIYVAIPSASRQELRDILSICNETGCELMTLPGMYQIINGEVSMADMKEVDIADLLGREQIHVDMDEIFTQLKGKTILVTGGGGSIGSELCRQIAGHEPKQLIILDIYENSAYTISLELQHKYPELDLVTLIGSVRDSRRLDQIFAKYHPDIVYHAAAHKHVPLMEMSPCEAIKNNSIGTYKTAYAAAAHGCKRFVLISTDKAVNPVNVMGASKRICEMVVQTFSRVIGEGRGDTLPPLCGHGEKITHITKDAKTEFAAVRFGNVLGSNGSVIPLFKQQIRDGGPVTVTHPDIIRYFMTIPEAVSLVLQAGVYAKGGEIFVFDMGEPVKIDTLARNMIKLCGLQPDVDIRIEYTGLRPGEKLYEEKLMAEEGMEKTKNKLIHIGHPLVFDETVFIHQMEELLEAASAGDENIRELVAKVVPTYHSFSC